VVLTGQFDGTVNFGGLDLTDSGGHTDVFLAKLGGTPTGVDDAREIVGLSVSAYPNPFNPSTTIRYSIPLKGRVTIEVHDARGARVATLLDEEKDAGDFTVPWTGRSDNGTRVSSGVYFARVAHPSGTKSYKMVLLK
jgi:hypothetical protein